MNQLEKLNILVERFKKEEAKFISTTSSYQETEARVEFIDQFFRLLGWDMDNSNGLLSYMRDVIREESQPTETSSKKPDYTFRISSVRKFFAEAKRPSIDIRTDKGSAFQVRSYGYTAGLAISVLTNFRTLRIYDTQLEPSSTDDANVGLLISIDYEDYPRNFNDIVAILGRDQVAGGSIESKFGDTHTGFIRANTSFLNRINNWRVLIAQDLHGRYATLTNDELNDLAQKIINRIVFIRMCEDRGIESQEMLFKVAKKKDFVELRELFKRMDTRYNTGLFDISQDRLQDIYEIDSELFLGIVKEIYAPNSPYSFSVLDSDFLGQVYELFLGHRLSFGSLTGDVILDYKPTYQHREIITTPQSLVNEVVRRVFDSKFKQLYSQGKLTIESIMSLRVLDVAVGSGRFLLRAFDELINRSIEVLRNTPGQPHLYRLTDENYQLDFLTKREILKNCLFGIDLDYNAVEVARFSLMVKLLEDETYNHLPRGHKILPNLDQNIIHGNTVVDTDFTFTSGPVYEKVMPLDWSLTELPQSFDVIIGNPPYIKTEEMKSFCREELDYFKKRYKTPYRQFDKYFVFIERSLSKLDEYGWIGMVVSNKWITIDSGAKLRELLTDKRVVVSDIVDFGNELVFQGKSTYVCILVLSKSGMDKFTYRHNKYSEFLLNPSEKGFTLSSNLLSTFGSKAWILPSSTEEAVVLEKLTANSIPLSDIADVSNGIQTSANDVFLITQFQDKGEYIEFLKNGAHWKIEKKITKPYIDNSERVVSYQPLTADARVLFPYERSSNGFLIPINPDVMERDYPHAMQYLTAYKERLLERDVSPPPKPGVFYAYGRHQALETAFFAPKIIYSVNQLGNKYSIDNVGILFASGGTAGEVAIMNPREGYALEFILGFLNQRAVEFFARKRGSPFRGGFYSRGSAVLNDAPVPRLDIKGNALHKKAHDDIVKDVCELITISEELLTAVGRKQTILVSRREALLRELELKFNALWEFKHEVNDLILPGET